MVNPLHPYVGRQDNDLPMVPYGSGVPANYVASYDANKIRSIGFRYPTVLVGWGYDKQGRPIPSDKPNLQQLNGTINAQSVNFSGGFPYPSGGRVPVQGYVAGPLDVRYDHRTGLWDSNHCFLAKLGVSEVNTLPNGADPNTYPANKYPWIEVAMLDSNGKSIPPTNAASGNTTQSYAFNLSEFGAGASPLPSGTIVQMQAQRVTTATPNNATLIYYFEHGGAGSSHYIAKITGYQAVNGNINRWLYSWMPQRWQTSDFTLVNDTVTASGLNLTLSAINLIEYNNPVGRGMVNPGINQTGNAYPASFSTQPVSSGSLVKMRALDSTHYYFEVVNAHDGSCPTCGSCAV